MNLVDWIKTRLETELQPSFLEVVDESVRHQGHAGHHPEGSHFAIRISADGLRGLSRVEAHRKIYAALGDAMRERIHALRITII